MGLACMPLRITDVEYFVHIPVGHLYVFFAEMSAQVLRPFLKVFFLLCSFCCCVVGSSHSLESSPVSDRWLAVFSAIPEDAFSLP